MHGFRTSSFFGPNYRSFYSPPLRVASAQGAVITADDGTEYLDAYNNVPVVGHSNPVVADAVHTALTRANTHTRYADATVDAYADKLGALLPGGLERLIFTCSGSEANDLALQIARNATGKTGVIVTDGAYHGTTTTAAAISPSLIGLDSIPDWVETVPVPDLASATFDAELGASVAQAAAKLDQRGHGAAALVLDTAFTSDGILAATSTFSPGRDQPQTSTTNPTLTQTAAAIRQAGGLYIADEVQAGFCRTGTWWAISALGVEPDLLTMGKPMANGLPLAGLAGRAELIDAFGSKQRYFNTFAAGPAVCAAGAAVLDELDRIGMPERIGQLEEELLGHLAQALRECRRPITVRTFGLMIGIDLSAADVTGADIKQAMYENGVLVGTTGPGGNTLKLRPPLAITPGQLERIANVLAGTLA